MQASISQLKEKGTLSGIIVETNIETGLAKKATRFIEGGSLGS
jgi:hypothetical protein